ncbi:MAG: hypothetical protein ABJA87_13720 [bacterium]
MSAEPAAGTATQGACDAPAPATLAHIADIGGRADLAELADVLVVLEDFLLHADADTVDELAGYRPGRPRDPHAWVCWVADRLGEHVANLRALTTPEAQPTTLIGAPR